ncbi:MAG: hypothetical protein JWQ54_1113 [Mucilaginibacter sp.]|nr:hypothetical protein [Mucilaginibacter sp.]
MIRRSGNDYAVTEPHNAHTDRQNPSATFWFMGRVLPQNLLQVIKWPRTLIFADH